MPNVSQLSAGEAFDDFTGQPLGEGYLTLQSSAGNRLCFSDPSSMHAYRLANPGEFNTTNNNAGDYNTEAELG